MMISFSPTVKLEKALRQLQTQLVEASSRINSITGEEKAYLNRCALISNVGASTRIENAILTDAQIDWIDTTLSVDVKATAFVTQKSFMLDKLSKNRERSLEEVVGCRAVLATVYAQAEVLSPLTETDIRALHHELLRYYPAAASHAGSYKTVSNRVVSRDHSSGEERVVLEPAGPGVMTATAMVDLVREYNVAVREHPWPILVATEFVFRFLAIHPFEDGNGRLGRALFIMALMQSDDRDLTNIAPFIAIDRHIEQSREQYYGVLYRASEGRFRQDPSAYEYEPLAWFFLKTFQAAISDIEHNRQRYARLQRLSETALDVLNAFKTEPETRLSVSLLEQQTGYARRTIQYVLRGLTEDGFLQRTGQGRASRYQLTLI
jgi:Fic family protein